MRFGDIVVVSLPSLKRLNQPFAEESKDYWPSVTEFTTLQSISLRKKLCPLERQRNQSCALHSDVLHTTLSQTMGDPPGVTL